MCQGAVAGHTSTLFVCYYNNCRPTADILLCFFPSFALDSSWFCLLGYRTVFFVIIPCAPCRVIEHDRDARKRDTLMFCTTRHAVRVALSTNQPIYFCRLVGKRILISFAALQTHRMTQALSRFIWSYRNEAQLSGPMGYLRKKSFFARFFAHSTAKQKRNKSTSFNRLSKHYYENFLDSRSFEHS